MKSVFYSLLDWANRYGAILLCFLWLWLGVFNLIYGFCFEHDAAKSKVCLISGGYNLMLAQAWYIIDCFASKR